MANGEGREVHLLVATAACSEDMPLGSKKRRPPRKEKRRSRHGSVTVIVGLVATVGFSLAALYWLAAPTLASYLVGGLALVLALTPLMPPLRRNPAVTCAVATAYIFLVVGLAIQRDVVLPPLPESPVVSKAAATTVAVLNLPSNLSGRRDILRASLVVMVSPADAKMFVDGEFHGVGSRTLYLEPGTHRIRVSRTGFQPMEDVVTIPTQRVLSLTLRAQ